MLDTKFMSFITGINSYQWFVLQEVHKHLEKERSLACTGETAIRVLESIDSIKRKKCDRI
jgi:hypothetical protein